MADFVQVMKDWRRLCETIQSKNQEKQQSGWCKGCPVHGVCVIDTEIKVATDKELAMIGERIQSWTAENPEPVYPTWGEWFLQTCQVGLTNDRRENDWIGLLKSHIPADIAEKLGLKPKEGI